MTEKNATGRQRWKTERETSGFSMIQRICGFTMFPRLCCSVSSCMTDDVAPWPYIFNCLGINYTIEMASPQDMEDIWHCSQASTVAAEDSNADTILVLLRKSVFAL